MEFRLGKPLSQCDPNHAIAAAKVNDVTRRKLTDPHQKIQCGPEPQVAKATVTLGVPVGHAAQADGSGSSPAFGAFGFPALGTIELTAVSPPV